MGRKEAENTNHEDSCFVRDNPSDDRSWRIDREKDIIWGCGELRKKSAVKAASVAIARFPGSTSRDRLVNAKIASIEDKSPKKLVSNHCVMSERRIVKINGV